MAEERKVGKSSGKSDRRQVSGVAGQFARPGFPSGPPGLSKRKVVHVTAEPAAPRKERSK